MNTFLSSEDSQLRWFLDVRFEVSLDGVTASSGNPIGFPGLYFECLVFFLRGYRATGMKTVHTQAAGLFSPKFTSHCPTLIYMASEKGCC